MNIPLIALLVSLSITGCHSVTPNKMAALEEPEWITIAPDSNQTKLARIEGSKIKNVILVVLDGVGLNQVLATRYKYYGINGMLHMERFPDMGLVNTHSADTSIITDSGAGGTALATGYKTNNGMIGMTPDGITRKNLVELFNQQGKSTALITYGNLSGATPAAFATHTPSRENKADISYQLLQSGVSFLFGDAIEFYGETSQHQSNEALAISNGYTVWNNKLPDNVPSRGNKHLILYDSLVNEQASLHADSVVLTPAAPSLRKVVINALAHLKNNPQGFFMMLEEDWTDSWGHAGKANMMAWHLKNADDALEPLIEFAKQDGETLILVTADHETGGLTIPIMSAVNKKFSVNFSTEEHTPALVPVYAYGPGSSYFHGVMDNTDIFKLLTGMLTFVQQVSK